MPSPGRRRAGWSTSAPSAAPAARPSPSTQAAPPSALATRPPVTLTRRAGTPRQRERVELDANLRRRRPGGTSHRRGRRLHRPARGAGPAVTAIDLGTLGGNFSETL